MKYSPLFWPILLNGDTIYVLDETKLPGKVTYLKVKNYKDACKVIRDMKTRAVGQVLLVMYTFIVEISNLDDKEKLEACIEKISNAVNNARPTLSFKILTDMVSGWAKSGAPMEKSIFKFLEHLKNKRIEQAQNASDLIKDGDTVLTHCNLSGLMSIIGQFCKLEAKKVSFIVTETRPYLQGSRLTAWELHKMGLDVTVIADNMVAHVMSEGKIDRVIVGADHLAQNGDIANKIGTYQIAILAKHFGIPFYVICPPVSKTASGKDINIEIRPEDELLEFNNVRIAPAGVKGYYPAFDVTPNNLITKHVYLEL